MASLTQRNHRILTPILPLVVAIFAVGCSSSSEDSDSPLLGAANALASVGPLGDYGPYSDSANAVRDAYVGNADTAGLSSDNASDVLDMALFGPLSTGDNKLFASGYVASTLTRHSLGTLSSLTNATEPGSRLCANTDGSGLMSWSGSSQVLHNEQTLREVNVAYSNCLIEGKLFDGSVKFAKAADAIDGATAAHFFDYENLQVSQADESVWRFNGVEAAANGAACDGAHPVRSYMSVERTGTGDVWLFSNIMNNLYSDDLGTRCSELYSDAAQSSITTGLLAHSEYGTVEISQISASLMSILGANGNVIEFEKTFQNIPEDVVSTGVNVLEDTVVFGTVRSAFSGVQQAPISQAMAAIRLGGLAPMIDVDQDGLTLGYEAAYELTETDAGDDVDLDGLSTLEELAVGSDPTDVRDTGWAVDGKISVLRDNLSAGSSLQSVFVSIENQANRVSAGDFSFNVRVSGDVTFATTEAESTPSDDFFGSSTSFAQVTCDYTNDALNELRCSAGGDEVCVSEADGDECETDLLLQRKFTLNVPTRGAYSVAAELAPHPTERNLANNLSVSED